MNRTRKVAVGLAGAAALLAGGIAAAAPALAQTDPPDPNTDVVECPYECDQLRERMHDQLRDRQGSGPESMGGGMHRHGNGPGDGTCRLADDPASDD